MVIHLPPLLWLFTYHLLAGIRVLFIDMEMGTALVKARRTAFTVLQLFQSLLSLPDQELFDILMETRQPEKKEFSRVTAKIRHTATSHY